MRPFSRLARTLGLISSRQQPQRRLRLDSLEDREVPAGYAVSGTVLTVTLANASETVTLTAGAAGVVNVAGSSAAVDNGVGGLVTFAGNNATIAAGVSAINIVDTASDTQVLFADSGASTYTHAFNILLDNGIANKVEIGVGTSTFSQSFSANAHTVTATVATTTLNLTGGGTNFTAVSANSVTLPTTIAGGGNVTVTSTDGAIAAGTITTNAGRSVTLNAFGDITQAGPINVGSGGTTSFSVVGNSSITLSAANELGTVSLSALHSTQTVTVKDDTLLTLGASNIGRAGLSLTTTNGNIIQNPASGIVQLPGAGAITTSTPASSQVDLSSAQNFFGGLVNVGGSPTTVLIRDSSPTASAANYTIPAGVTSLLLAHSNAPLVLGGVIPSTVTFLTAVGVGIYQSAPLNFSIITVADLNGTNGPIILDNPTNDFNTLRVRTSSSAAYDITIADANGVIFGGNTSTLGNGRLSVTTSNGDITQSQPIQTGTGSVSNFKATAGNITLTGSNLFGGRVDAAVSSTNTLSITNGAALNLGNISTGAGSATVSGSQILQAPGTKLLLGGVSSFTATTGTLTNPGNKFAGAVSLSASQFKLIGTGDIDLGTSNVTTLSVTANNNPSAPLGGNITDSGVVTSGATAEFNGGLTSGGVTLDGANLLATVSGRVNGASSFTINDTAGGLNLDNLVLGTGPLSVTTTGGGISQSGSLRTTGTTGVVTLNAGANAVNLSNSGNEFGGKVTVLGTATGLAVTNRGNIDLATTPPLLATTASVVLTAGKVVTLPPTALSVGSLSVSANKTLFQNDVTANSGSISVLGSANLSKASAPFNLTASNAVAFGGDGDVQVTKDLVVTAPNGLAFSGATWKQGANNLTVSAGGLDMENFGLPSRFVTSGSPTITLNGGGNLIVGFGTVFQAGDNPTVAETASVVTTGNVFLVGDLQVGLGTTTDKLALSGGGDVILTSSVTHLVGTGVAAGAAQPVVSVTGGQVLNTFADSVNAAAAAVPFKAGRDAVLLDYSASQSANGVVSVLPGPLSDTDGTVTGFLQNGQAYTVTSSLGAAAGLVVTENLAPDGSDLGLDIVVRTNAAASTLTVSPAPGGNNGPGTILLHSIAVNGTGPVTINAPLADLTNGEITIQGTLAAATLRNVSGSTIKSGGPTTAGTTLTAKIVSGSDISIGGVLTAFTAEDVSLLAPSRIAAEKFGTVKVTGSTIQGTTGGDLGARLTTRTITLGTNLSSVTVAGTLSGAWDIFGDIGTVKSRITTNWSLGEKLNTGNGGAFARNPDGIRNIATSLDIGRATVGSVDLAVTGNVKALLATDWTTTGTARAGSFGSITTKTNTADFLNGANGNLSADILATGSLAGTAVGSITVAGNYATGAGKLTAWNGNIGAIKVSKSLSGTINATTAATGGSIASLSAGTISGLTVDAKRIGSITGVTNAAILQFGDIGSSSNFFTLRGNDGTAARNAIGTITAGRNLTSNTFNLFGGNLGSVTVKYRSSGNTFNLTDASMGKVGSFTTGESSGDTFKAEAIGAITTKGFVQVSPSSPGLLGDLGSFSLTAYRETGSAVGVGAIKVAGNIGSASVTSPNGVTSVTATRDIGGLTITTDSILPGTDVIGRVGGITGGSINALTLTGESVGAITTKGYLAPENGTFSRIAGVFNGVSPANPSVMILKGAGVVSGVAVGAITTDSEIKNLTVNAPLGVTSVTAKGKLTTVNITADHLPLALTTVKPAFGKIGSVTGYDYSGVNLRAASIGTVKSAADFLSGSRGSVTGSTFVARDTAPAATGIASITTDGNFGGANAVYSPSGLGTLSVDESLASSTVAAGYQGTGKSISVIKAGDVAGATIVTRQLGSFNVVGNLEPGSSLGGGVAATFVNVFGNTGGVGLGTFSALGTVSAGTVFDITDGNLTSFTAARLRDSAIQVGARFTKGNALAGGVTFVGGATPRSLDSLSLTAPALGATPTPEDVRDGSGFRDSYVAAEKIGTVTVTNVAATLDPATETQGVAFKSPVANAGTVSVNGTPVVANDPALPSKFAETGI